MVFQCTSPFSLSKMGCCKCHQSNWNSTSSHRLMVNDSMRDKAVEHHLLCSCSCPHSLDLFYASSQLLTVQDSSCDLPSTWTNLLVYLLHRVSISSQICLKMYLQLLMLSEFSLTGFMTKRFNSLISVFITPFFNLKHCLIVLCTVF